MHPSGGGPYPDRNCILFGILLHMLSTMADPHRTIKQSVLEPQPKTSGPRHGGRDIPEVDLNLPCSCASDMVCKQRTRPSFWSPLEEYGRDPRLNSVHLWGEWSAGAFHKLGAEGAILGVIEGNIRSYRAKCLIASICSKYPTCEKKESDERE